MRIFIYLLLFLLSTASVQADRLHDRTLFKQAQSALDKGELRTFMQTKQQLSGYPLQPYLDYLYLRKRLAVEPANTISQFLTEHKGAFYTARLRKAWLLQLANTGQWQRFLTHYQETNNAQLQCHRLQALIRTGESQQAHLDTANLWLVGKSQHKACDAPFAHWQRQGGITTDLRKQRMLLALEANEFGLAAYLAKQLPNAATATRHVAAWKAIHANPKQQLSPRASSLRHDDDMTRRILQHGIARLARKDPQQAYQVWQFLSSRYQFSDAQRSAIQQSIGQRAALNRDPNTLRYYGDAVGDHWRVRAALWQQNWPEVLIAIDGLDRIEQKSLLWRYWRARALAKTGKEAEATAIYQILATERDYFGFLAADQLGQAYQMNHHPLAIDPAALNAFAMKPATQQLREFYQMGLEMEANRQAYHFKTTLPQSEIEMLATLTHRWGWHNQTIALLGSIKSWDALDLRFPPLFDAALTDAGQAVNLDPNWLIGLARQESAFDVRAHSRVGARGLMQLMPATARSMAKKLGRPLKSMNDLYLPSVNIPLGSGYLRQVYDQHQQNQALASASYNAGPHRVTRWLPPHNLPADIWAANIPFTETRGYVRSVLSYAAVFQHQRKQAITPLKERMPIVRPSS